MKVTTEDARSSGVGLLQVRQALRAVSWLLVVWTLIAALFFWASKDNTTTFELARESYYLALQLLFANVDGSKFHNPVVPAEWVLNFARYIVPWLLAIFGVLAFVKSLRVWIRLKRKSKLHWLTCHSPLIFIVGLSEKGLAILRAERARNPKIEIVVLELDGNKPQIALAESLGATVWIGDARSSDDIRLCCWTRPERVFAVTDDDRTNLMVLDQISKLYHGIKESAAIGSSVPLRPAMKTDVFTHFENPQELRLAEDLGVMNRDTDHLWTHVFNYNHDAAAYLLHKHPVVPGTIRPRVLLLGLGPLGYEIFRELLRLMHFDRHGETPLPEIVTLDRDSATKEKALDEMSFLRESIAGLTPFVIWTHLTRDVLNLHFDEYKEIRGENGFSHVFVQLGSEVRNLSIAHRVGTWEKLDAEMNPGKIVEPCKVIGIAYENEAAHWVGETNKDRQTLIENLQVATFDLSSVYSPEAIQWRENTRKLGIAINACYTEIYKKENNAIRNANKNEIRLSPLSLKGGTFHIGRMQLDDPMSIAEQNGNRSWQKTNERDRRSSLAQARHIGIKLAQMDFCLAPTSPGERLLSQSAQFEEALLRNLDSLAECEHRRWSAAQLIDGFVPVVFSNSIQAETCEKFRALAGVHQSLVDFDCLPAEVKAIDSALMYNLPQILTIAKMKAAHARKSG